MSRADMEGRSKTNRSMHENIDEDTEPHDEKEDHDV